MSIFCIVMLLVLIVCVVGNSLVVLAICTIKALQVPSTRLLLALAFGDLAFGNVIFFNNAMCGTSEVNTRTSVVDKMTFYFRSLINAITLVAIALERYLAVIKPFYHKVHVNKSWFNKAYISIYLLPPFFTAPGWYLATAHTSITSKFLNTSDVANNYNNTSRNNMGDALYAYEVTLVCLCTMVPALIMSILYGRIIYRIWLKPDTQGTNTAILKARRKMTKLLLTVTIVFYLCWLPLLLYPSQQISDEFKRWLILFPLLNTALNPIIYCLHSTVFRQSLKMLFCSYCCLKKGRNDKQSGVAMSGHPSLSKDCGNDRSTQSLSVVDIKKD